MFYIYHKNLLSQSKPTSDLYVYPPDRDRQLKLTNNNDPIKFLKNMLKHMDGVLGSNASSKDKQKALLDWFSTSTTHKSAPKEWKEIRRDNLIEWLSWAFWSKPVSEINKLKSTTKDLEEMIKLIEIWTGEKIEEGRTEAVSMRLSIDEIRSEVSFFVESAACLQDCGRKYYDYGSLLYTVIRGDRIASVLME